MIYRNLDDIAFKTIVQDRPQNTECEYGSPLVKELMDLIGSPNLAMYSVRPFEIIYMYNNKFPIVVNIFTNGLAGYWVSTRKSTEEDLSKLHRYCNKEGTV